MPEMSTKYVPKHMGDKNPNPRLLKFVRRVTDRLPAKIKGVTTNDPEYWGFACIFEDELDKEMSDNALDLLLDMKVRKKYPYSQMMAKCKKIGMEDDKAFKMLEKLNKEDFGETPKEVNISGGIGVQHYSVIDLAIEEEAKAQLGENQALGLPDLQSDSIIDIPEDDITREVEGLGITIDNGDI